VVRLDSLGSVRALASARLLEQRLISCPGCDKPAAVHLDGSGQAPGARPVVVRLICPDGCVVGEDDVLDRLPPAPWPADAPLSA
jgi:hypothetical protein